MAAGCEEARTVEAPPVSPPPALLPTPLTPPEPAPAGPSPLTPSPAPLPTLAPEPSPLPPGEEPLYITIDQGYYEGRQYRSFPVTKPQLFFVEDSRDLEVLRLRGLNPLGGDLYRVSEKAFEDITRVDFGRYFVVIAFSSSAMRPDGDLRIEEVTKAEDGTVHLKALVYEPGETLRPATTRTAYHAIRMARNQFSPGKTHDFVLLNLDGAEVVRARDMPNEEGKKMVPVPFENLGIGSTGLGTTKPGLFRIIDSEEAARSLVDELISAGRPNLPTPTDGQGKRPPAPRIPSIPESLRAMLETDYSKDLSIVVFPRSTMVRVDWRDGVVELRSVFPLGEVGYQPLSPSQVIRISRSNLVQKGALAFVLIDHLGFERGRTRAVIN